MADQDVQGNVIYGGEPMGPAPTSVPYGPSAAPADDEDEQAPPAMPDTGGAIPLAFAVPALVVGALGLAGRRNR